MSFDGTIPPKLLEHPLYQADQWIATFIDRAERDWLDGLPPLLRLDVDGLGEVLFCHATPRSRRGADHRLHAAGAARADPRAGRRGRSPSPATPTASSTCTAGGRRMVNAGSVGRPYEHGPGAYWLRLGPDVELRRTDYDTGAAVARFAAVGYPLADSILAPVDADAIARRYEDHGDEALDPSSLHRASREVRHLRVGDRRRGSGSSTATRSTTPGFDGDMVAFIAAGAPGGERRPVTDAQLLAPLRPRSLRDFLAFEGHLKNAYARLGREIPAEWYEVPAYYKGMPDTVIGPDDDDPVAGLDGQARPRARAGRRDRRGRARHRARPTPTTRSSATRSGTTCPPATCRRASCRSAWGPGKAKDWDGSNVLGPCIATPDELDLRGRAHAGAGQRRGLGRGHGRRACTTRSRT